jgi:hypothetical protein
MAAPLWQRWGRVAMTDLIERLEAATGPSWELDASINYAVNPHASGIYGHPPYTTSIDAALTLVPEGWTGLDIISYQRRTRYTVELSRLLDDDVEEDLRTGRGPTIAIALCVAALRARAA